MSHLSYKSRQTAALYVADDLPDPDRESFELHMMNCTECVEDVETWRVLARGIVAHTAPAARTAPGTGRRSAAGVPRADDAVRPAAAVAVAARAPAVPPRGWQIAASVVFAMTFGLLGGWSLHRGPAASLDDASLGFASLAGPTRSGECTVLRLAAGTRVVALRVPGALPGTDLVASRPDGSPLGAGNYSVRAQPDGSWLLRLTASAVVGQEVLLEARDRAAGDAAEPVGCIAAVTVP